MKALEKYLRERERESGFSVNILMGVPQEKYPNARTHIINSDILDLDLDGNEIMRTKRKIK